MAEFLIYGMLGVLALLIIAPPLLSWAEDRLIHRDDGHTRRHREFHDARRRAGASFSEGDDTMFLQEALARLRREASDAVLKDPSLWCEAIQTAKNDAINRVGERDPALVPGFAAHIVSLSYGHILYPDEAVMVDRQVSGHSGRPTIDQRAALRIVR